MVISALNIFRYLFWHINVQVQTVFSLKTFSVVSFFKVIRKSKFNLMLHFFHDEIKILYDRNTDQENLTQFLNPGTTYVFWISPRGGLFSIAFQSLLRCIIHWTIRFCREW